MNIRTAQQKAPIKDSHISYPARYNLGTNHRGGGEVTPLLNLQDGGLTLPLERLCSWCVWSETFCWWERVKILHNMNFTILYCNIIN